MIEYKVDLCKEKHNYVLLVFFIYFIIRSIYLYLLPEYIITEIIYYISLIFSTIFISLVVVQLLFSKKIYVYISEESLYDIDDSIVKQMEDHDNIYLLGFTKGMRPIYIRSEDVVFYKLYDINLLPIQKSNREIIDAECFEKQEAKKITWEEFFNE